MRTEKKTAFRLEIHRPSAEESLLLLRRERDKMVLLAPRSQGCKKELETWNWPSEKPIDQFCHEGCKVGARIMEERITP
jgi:hypothetical protein